MGAAPVPVPLVFAIKTREYMIEREREQTENFIKSTIPAEFEEVNVAGPYPKALRARPKTAEFAAPARIAADRRGAATEARRAELILRS